MAGDVVPSRASRKANGRLLQAVEAVGGHSLPQSKLRTSPRFLAPIFTLCDVLRTSFLFDLIYTLCYVFWHGAEIQKTTPEAHYAGSAR